MQTTMMTVVVLLNVSTLSRSLCLPFLLMINSSNDQIICHSACVTCVMTIVYAMH